MRPRTPIAVVLVLTALTVLTACTSEEPVPVDPAVRTSIEDSTQSSSRTHVAGTFEKTG